MALLLPSAVRAGPRQTCRPGLLGSVVRPYDTPPTDAASLANLQGWWEADTLLGTVAAGASFTPWTGKTLSRDLAQGTAGNRPTLQLAVTPAERPVVRFDGSNDFMSLSFTLNHPYWYVVALTYRTSYTANAIAVAGVTSNSATLFRTGASQMSLFNVSAQAPNVTTTPQAWHVYSAVFNGANSGIRIDGIASAIGNPGSGNAAGIVVGTNIAGLQPAAIDVAGLAAFSGAINVAQAQRWERYFGAKYGIAVA